MAIDFSLGCDPEMVAFAGKRFIASNTTPYGRTDTELGADSCGRPFEVRPRPSRDPLQVVANIHSILTTHVLRNPSFFDYDWKAGSYYRTPKCGGRDTPIGGHIHIGGLKKVLPAISAAVILDNYVGVISILVENRKEGRLRRQFDDGLYGMAADVRDDMPWGYEYRTPSSWLTSPYVAAGFLCLTKAVIWEAVNNDSFSPLVEDLSIPFEDMDIATLREYYVDYTRPSILTLSLYPTYKPYLDFLHMLIDKGLTWYPKVSMKDAWGIIKPGASPLKPTLSRIWKRHQAGEMKVAA